MDLNQFHQFTYPDLVSELTCYDDHYRLSCRYDNSLLLPIIGKVLLLAKTIYYTHSIVCMCSLTLYNRNEYCKARATSQFGIVHHCPCTHIKSQHSLPFTVSEHESMRRKGAISPDMAETKEAKAKSASMKRPAKNRIASFK